MMILAMEKTQQNFAENPNLLAINHFWQKLFVPLYPILADLCQTSILSVKYATVPMFDIIAYQLLKKTTPSKTQTFQPLASLLKDKTLTSFDIQDALLFKNLPQLKINQAKISEHFFSKQQHQMIMGYLLAKSPLTSSQLQNLLAWTTLLSLKLLHDFCSQKHPSALTEKQLTQWRDYQIFALASANTPSILQIIDLENHVNLSQSRQHTNYLNNQPHIQAILQNMLDFVSQHPLNKTFNTNLQNLPIETKPEPVKKLLIIDGAVDDSYNDYIFQPIAPPRLTWLEYLQKYWIATSIVLSGVVFGAMNFIMPDKANKNTAQTATVKPTQTTQDDKKRFNDVAIVKIASTASNIETTDEKGKVTNTTEKSAPTKATQATQTTNKASVSEKTTEKAPTVAKTDKTEKPETKRQATDNQKSETKNSDKHTTDSKVNDKNKKANNNKADNKETDKKLTDKTDKKSADKKTNTTKDSKTENNKTSDKKDDKKSTNQPTKTEKPSTNKDDKNRKRTDEKSTQTEKKTVEKSVEKTKTTETPKAPPKTEPEPAPAQPKAENKVENNDEN